MVKGRSQPNGTMFLGLVNGEGMLVWQGSRGGLASLVALAGDENAKNESNTIVWIIDVILLVCLLSFIGFT